METGATLLDLIITNYPGFFVCSGTYSPPANCDHWFIFAKFCISFSKPKCYTRQVWDYSSLNAELLNSCLNDFDWDSCLVGCNDINLAYQDWFSNFQSLVEQHVHHKTVVICPHDKPWMNGKVRGAIRKRNRLLKIHSRLKLPALWEKYRIQRNYTSSLIRYSKKIYYENLNLKMSDPTICSKK